VECGLAKQLGTIRPGMIADLVVVQGDALTESSVFERVALVIKSGAVVVP
jgi:imidazolonepropionase-like amidohydrolase